jgi:hypothetical protein
MSRSDSSLSQTLWSVVDATYDFLIAFLGSVFVVFLSLLVVNDAAGSPVSESLVGIVALVLAFGASYLFVAGPWSLDRFTEFVLIFFISVVGLALLSAIPLLIVGGVPSDSLIDRVAKTVVIVVALAIAVVNTYLRPLYAGTEP